MRIDNSITICIMQWQQNSLQICYTFDTRWNLWQTRHVHITKSIIPDEATGVCFIWYGAVPLYECVLIILISVIRRGGIELFVVVLASILDYRLCLINRIELVFNRFDFWLSLCCASAVWWNHFFHLRHLFYEIEPIGN